MPLHPTASAFLETIKEAAQPHQTSLAAFRKAVEVVVNPGAILPIERVENLVISGGDGQDLVLRLYAPASDKPLPVVVWAHGGSFTRGSLDTFDAARRALAKFAHLIVIAVDQRLSPEAQFPAPVEDAYAAAAWAAGNATDIGGDPALVGIGGESSGGNIAAAVTLLARDRGGPAIAFQVLLMPLVDATCSSPSVDQLADGFGLTKDQLIWCYEQYAPGVQRTQSLLSPLHAIDLRGLPPAVVITLEYDPVRDEGERYAARLEAAGVPVLKARIGGMVHHFPGPQAFQAVITLMSELLGSRRNSAHG